MHVYVHLLMHPNSIAEHKKSILEKGEKNMKISKHETASMQVDNVSYLFTIDSSS